MTDDVKRIIAEQIFELADQTNSHETPNKSKVSIEDINYIRKVIFSNTALPVTKTKIEV